MVAAVASSTTPITQPSMSDAPSGARKRRRQILQSRHLKTDLMITTTSSNNICSSYIEMPEAKKLCTEVSLSSDCDASVSSAASGPATDTVTSPPVPSTVLSAPCKVSHCDDFESSVDPLDDNSKTKKPQMRYEPDVPMTKEEAAVWRREQRRKRNRESAAASRQRQRDRITELEVEVDDWKVKFQTALDRLQKLESLYGPSETSSSAPDMVASASASSISVSPCPSPSPDQSPSSPSSSSGQENTEMEPLRASSLDETEQHLKEKNSLPA